MQHRVIGLLLIVVSCVAVSCSSKQDSPSGPGSPYAFVVAGKSILNVMLPSGAKAFEKDGMITVVDASGNKRFYLWTVKNVKALGDVLPSVVAETIKTEFLDFKPTGHAVLRLAGVTAKEIDGSGKEADDGDAGNAEVLIFQKGRNFFAACVHGEGNGAKISRPFMMQVLETAETP